MVSKKAAIAGGAIAAAAVAALAATQLVKAKTGTVVATLRLSAASANESVNQDDQVTVVAEDSSGNPVPGVAGIALNVNGQTLQSFPTTGPAGASSLQVSFAAAGTYSLQAVV